MSGTADSLYSQDDLFLPYRLMLRGQGGNVCWVGRNARTMVHVYSGAPRYLGHSYIEL